MSVGADEGERERKIEAVIADAVGGETGMGYPPGTFEREARLILAGLSPVPEGERLRNQLDLALGEARRLEGDEAIWPTAPLSKRLNDLLRAVRVASRVPEAAAPVSLQAAYVREGDKVWVSIFERWMVCIGREQHGTDGLVLHFDDGPDETWPLAFKHAEMVRVIPQPSMEEMMRDAE